MAKSVMIILVSALCFFAFLGYASADVQKFFLEGSVYCDTCRTQFITRLSEHLKGAKVRLECRDFIGGNITYSSEAVTDETGTYRLPVEGDREEEICEVVLEKSPRDDCKEVSTDDYLKKAARISITSNDGITSPVRVVSPLGFLKDKPLAECPQVLKELGLKAKDLI